MEFQSTPSTRRVTQASICTGTSSGFQSTPSTRRVTFPGFPTALILVISIHTLHTEGDAQLAIHGNDNPEISIHTLHTEGDVSFAATVSNPVGISIHTLHTEGDSPWCMIIVYLTIFQSTPSTRRVTFIRNHRNRFIKIFQSTPSTRRVTSAAHITTGKPKLISIHTLHTEGDLRRRRRKQAGRRISIHTLHTEGDLISTCAILAYYDDFNPHPPHGG